MKFKICIIVCAITISLGSVNVCRASDDNSIETIADVTLVRPGCFVATVIGTACFIIALPIAAMSQSVSKTADTLVVVPAQATFTRPIGDFSSFK